MSAGEFSPCRSRSLTSSLGKSAMRRTVALCRSRHAAPSRQQWWARTGDSRVVRRCRWLRHDAPLLQVSSGRVACSCTHRVCFGCARQHAFSDLRVKRKERKEKRKRKKTGREKERRKERRMREREYTARVVPRFSSSCWSVCFFFSTHNHTHTPAHQHTSTPHTTHHTPHTTHHTPHTTHHTPHSTAHTHSTAQHSTAQHSTAQHSTAQHSTAQHSTAQHSTAHTTHHTHECLDTCTAGNRP